jgi:5-methylthioadenosine/S-adenosylhomocysteine deaminase
MAIILSGGAVLTANRADAILPCADIRIDAARIAEIGTPETLKRPGDEVIDCRNTLVIPGLVNVHTHVCTGLFRGLVEDVPRVFWSEFYGVPGQGKFGIDDYILSARLSCAELLLNGVTCIADRFGFMDRIAPVIEQSGLRAIVGHTLTDKDAPADWRTADAVLECWGTNKEARVSAGIAPHALDTSSDSLLRVCATRAASLGCPVFVHAAQSEREVAALRARGHVGALACLTATGLTGPHVVAAHCIYLEQGEIEAWPASAVAIAHCPASNLKIEARTLPIFRLLGKVAIGLGTDWALTNNAMDILAEARLAALVGKMLADDPTVLGVMQVLRMATIDGARVLGLDGITGSIEPGKRADIVVMDLSLLQANPRHNLASNLLYAMTPRCVRDVMVDGKLLVRSGKLTRADEAELAQEAARRWNRQPRI